MAQFRKLSLIIIVLTMSYSVVKSQSTNIFASPSTSQSLVIQVHDSSTLKELGYFKFNTVTKVVSTRGTQKYVWDFFTNQIFLPMQQREIALRKIKDALYVDGRVRCWECLLEALRQWDSIRIVQNVPDFIDK